MRAAHSTLRALALALTLGGATFTSAQALPIIDLTQGLQLPSFLQPRVGDVPIDAIRDPDFLRCFSGGTNDQLIDPLSCLGFGLTGTPPLGPLPGGGTFGEDQGVVDVIFSGSEYALNVPWTISVFMPPVVHLTHQDTYHECLNDMRADPDLQLADCTRRWHTATPAAPPEMQQRFNDDVTRAWRTFERSMISDLDRALNAAPSCLQPPGLNCLSMVFLGAPPVFPVPDMACVTARLAAEYPRAFAQHYPIMWTSIMRAVVTHLPNTVAYGLTLNPIDPLDGSFVAPIYAPVPDINLTLEDMGIPFTFEQLRDPDFISGLAGDARREIYYHEPFLALLGLNINVPVLPGELHDGWPGIEPLEQDKIDLGIATAMQYEFIGYTVFNQLYTDRRLHWFFRTTWRAPFFEPALRIRCAFPPLRTPFGIPVPVPGYLGVPTLDEISVPEGYLIPRTAGDNMWTPFPW